MRIVVLAIIFACVSYVLYGYSPASADAVNETVKLASSSIDAKSVLSKELRNTPNPNNFELGRINSRVEEIIVTETARVVTGDPALMTPAEQELIEKRREANYQAVQRIKTEEYIEKVKAKSFVEMSYGEFIVLVLHYSPNIALVSFSILLMLNLILRVFNSV